MPDAKIVDGTNDQFRAMVPQIGSMFVGSMCSWDGAAANAEIHDADGNIIHPTDDGDAAA